MTAPVAVPDSDIEVGQVTGLDEERQWKVLVWDDPINLMSYMSFIFRKLFGFSKEKADRLMMEVHTEG